MSYTYKQILDRMNNKFTELSGYEPENASDSEIKIKLLAGELYSLCTEIDRIKLQMFPNTATGQYLDMHARQRGLSRIKGDKASGFVIFRLDMPVDHDITIPKGTVCSNSDGSLRYLTVYDEIIPRNTTERLIECEAENSGQQYNVARNIVKVMITYFSVGMSITNASSFIGGTDDESDEAFRKRIEESYKNTPNGANEQYYINLAKSVDGIHSATVTGSMQSGGINVCVGGKGGVPSNDAYQNVIDLLNISCPFGINLTVTTPELVTVNVTASISVKNGYNESETLANVQRSIASFFSELAVGEDFKTAALGKAVYESYGVDNYSFSGMSDISIGAGELAKLGTVHLTVAN